MTTGLAFSFGCSTDTGTVRLNNEDAALASPTLLAVSDGVGGAPAGEVASHLAVRAAGAVLRSGGTPQDAVDTANDMVLSTARLNSLFSNMACTLTIATVSASTVRIVHIGDSRGYLLREGSLRQVTDDHTVVAKLIAEGTITPEQAAVDPRRNTLSQVIGRPRPLEPLVRSLRCRAGDRIVLCTDGVSHFLDLAGIESAAKATTPQEAADALTAAALAIGSNDNVTAVVADLVPAGSA